ncbi:hypothetical protein LIER_20986 [Lithospermum erythrorhizon]|uniref:Uncharacterized protein n=1 Tax=Lithospermum erythrorhizon TaxID=34254 RepID=A0AAV3QPI2_LITER
MFSKIGSYLGKPLFVDSTTTYMVQISYARIYVEIEAIRETPEFVPLVNENGVEFLQKVECEWKPLEEGNLPSLEKYESIVDKITPQEVNSRATVVNMANSFSILDEAEQNDANDAGESSKKVLQAGMEKNIGRGTGQKLRQNKKPDIQHRVNSRVRCKKIPFT